MFDYSRVDETVERIVEEFSPEKIIVFGSAARHEADENSDLDILVVMDTDEPPYLRAVPIHLAVAGIRVPKDILVMTPEEFERCKDDRCSFVYGILRSGVLVYDQDHQEGVASFVSGAD